MLWPPRRHPATAGPMPHSGRTPCISALIAFPKDQAVRNSLSLSLYLCLSLAPHSFPSVCHCPTWTSHVPGIHAGRQQVQQLHHPASSFSGFPATSLAACRRSCSVRAFHPNANYRCNTCSSGRTCLSWLWIAA